MSLKDKLNNILKVSEDEYYDEPETDEFEDVEEEEEEATVTHFSRPAREKVEQNKVVSINSAAKFQVVLTKPKSLEEARNVGDSINQKKTVVLNLELVNNDVARRILDFLSGVTYANKANLSKIANGTYMITPNNVGVDGELLNELGNNGFVFDR